MSAVQTPVQPRVGLAQPPDLAIEVPFHGELTHSVPPPKGFEAEPATV